MQITLNHHASPQFWECYSRLASAVEQLADSNFALLKENPRHPSMHFKQIGQFWSVRVGIRYRSLGVSITDGVVGYGLARTATMTG